MNNKQLNIKKINEMAFIYNALSHGWTVRKLNNKTYKFHKKGIEVNLNRFITKNLSLENIFN